MPGKKQQNGHQQDNEVEKNPWEIIKHKQTKISRRYLNRYIIALCSLNRQGGPHRHSGSLPTLMSHRTAAM